MARASLLWLAAALFAALLPLPAAAQPSMKDKEPGVLEWRFKEKDKFITETQVNLTQIRRAPGFPVFRDEVIVNTVSTFQIRKVEEDGTVEFDQRIDSTRIRFDGTNKLTAAGLADLFTKMQGSTFRIVLGPDRTVKSIEGYAEMIKRLSVQQPPELVERFRMMVTEDDLKAATEEGFGFLPDKPVKVGDQWTRPTKLRMGPQGAISATLTYTLQSLGSDGKAKIQVGQKGAEFKADAAAGMARPDYTLDSRNGTIVFDVKNGRLLSSDFTLKLKGNSLVQNPINGVGAVPVETLQQNVVKIVVKDRSPKQ